MADSNLTGPEQRFLAELEARGVKYMIVGLTAATLQGANTTTVDVDLWFESIGDRRIGEAANAAGGIWVSGSGMMPAKLGGVLDRVLASKRAANRPKDRAVIPALEEALAAIEDAEP